MLAVIRLAQTAVAWSILTRPSLGRVPMSLDSDTVNLHAAGRAHLPSLDFDPTPRAHMWAQMFFHVGKSALDNVEFCRLQHSRKSVY